MEKTSKAIEPASPTRRNTIEAPIPFSAVTKDPIEPIQQMIEQPTASSVKTAAAKIPEPSPPPLPKPSYMEENLGTIRTILQEQLVYPKIAIKLRQQGEAKIGFYLFPNGEVSDIELESSSGFSLLDNAAQTLIIENAQKFPKPRQKVHISIPIGYRLR